MATPGVTPSITIATAALVALTSGLVSGLLAGLATFLTLRIKLMWMSSTINNHAEVLSALECVKMPVADLRSMPDR